MNPREICSANRAAILDAVLAAGMTGTAIKTLMLSTRLKIKCVGDHLRNLLLAGLVEKSCLTGSSVRWGAPGIAAATLSRASEAQRRELRRKRAVTHERRAVESWADEAPVRRIVPAAGAMPLGCRAVRSVFELANQS